MINTKFSIYQIKNDTLYAEYRFSPYSFLKGRFPDKDMYDLVYEGKGEDLNAEKLFMLFQHDDPSCPAEFKGHSLSVSDIIEINFYGRCPVVLYCGSIGFKVTGWKESGKEAGSVRYTNADLMNSAFDVCLALGLTESWLNIQDYYLAESRDVIRLTDISFDMIPEVAFGGSEGAYVDVHLAGYMDGSGKKKIHCGTFKTLETSASALMAAGKLAGALVWASREFINHNFSYFLSDKEIEEARKGRAS